MKKRHLSFESLEPRLVMDGNVMVSVVAGDLKVVGDSAANQITVSFDQATTSWTVAGIPGSNTRVNGQAFVTVRGVTNSVWIQMGLGNDVVKLLSFQVPNELHVELGPGNDVFEAGINGGNHVVNGTTWLEGQDGADVLSVANTRIRGNLWVKLGAGNDSFQMNASQVDAYFRLDGDDGDDNVLLTNLAVANLLLRFQSGNDSLEAQNVIVGGSLDVYMMSGDDRAVLVNCRAAEAYLNGGIGTDSLALSGNVFGRLRIFDWERVR